MEIYEFHHLIMEGFGPDRSGFLSAFFALVGTHGLHVTSGLIWMAVLMFQISRRGLTSTNRTRIMCLSLFWHFGRGMDLCVLCCLSDGGDVMSHSNDHGASRQRKTYMTGFILSIILTVIPFWMVMNGSASKPVIRAQSGDRGDSDSGASGLLPAHEHQVR